MTDSSTTYLGRSLAWARDLLGLPEDRVYPDCLAAANDTMRFPRDTRAPAGSLRWYDMKPYGDVRIQLLGELEIKLVDGVPQIREVTDLDHYIGWSTEIGGLTLTAGVLDIVSATEDTIPDSVYYEEPGNPTLWSVRLGGCTQAAQFTTANKMMVAATHLLQCHPHHFAVLHDELRILCSEQAILCLSKWYDFAHYQVGHRE